MGDEKSRFHGIMQRKKPIGGMSETCLQRVKYSRITIKSPQEQFCQLMRYSR